METIRMESVRRMSRWCVGLLSTIAAFLSLFLFLTTAGPVPHLFVPTGELGFRFNNGRPDGSGNPCFLSLSPSGRCFVTLTRPDGDANLTTVHDTATLEILGSFRGGLDTKWHFELSPDHRTLFTASNNRLSLRHLRSDGQDVEVIESPWGVEEPSGLGAISVFSPDSQNLLIHSLSRAFCYRLSNHKSDLGFQAPEKSAIFGCFFGPTSGPMALVWSEGWHVWDLAGRQPEAVLDSSLPEQTSSLGNPVISLAGVDTAPSLVRLSEGRETLIIRSLGDGQLLQTLPVPANRAMPLRFSPDARYLICTYRYRDPIIARVGTWHEKLYAWLRSYGFDYQERLALVDLATGKKWLKLVGTEECAFTEDGARMISFTKEGRYEYDVPPRWQFFTPWAWAALAAWLSLLVVWWKLRKRRPGTAPVV